MNIRSSKFKEEILDGVALLLAPAFGIVSEAPFAVAYLVIFCVALIAIATLWQEFSVMVVVLALVAAYVALFAFLVFVYWAEIDNSAQHK